MASCWSGRVPRGAGWLVGVHNHHLVEGQTQSHGTSWWERHRGSMPRQAESSSASSPQLPQAQKESPHDPGVHWDAWRRLGWMPGWPSVVLVGVFFVAAEWFVCCFGCRPDLRRVLDCTVSSLLSRKCRVTTDCRKLTVCQLWLCRNEGQTQHSGTSVPRDPK